MNVDGVRTLLAAVEPQARVIHVASVSTLGPASSPDRPADETTRSRRGGQAGLRAHASATASAWRSRRPRAGRDVVVANLGF